MNFSHCPRCGEIAYEILKSHCHCVNCSYSPTLDEKIEPAIPEWALSTLKGDWKKKNEAKLTENEVGHSLALACASVARGRRDAQPSTGSRG
jgi:hypothetical protein